MRSLVDVLIVALMATGALETSHLTFGKSPSQLCVEPTAGPVIQDTGWHLVNSAFNYSDYSNKFLEPNVLKEGGLYVMYVRQEINSTTGIYRGVSADGIEWNVSSTPALTLGPTGAWDDSVVFSPNVVWNGTGYMMYYVGDHNSTSFRQIGVAFSTDGITWTKFAGNPVVTHGPGAYDSRYTRGPSVVFDHGAYKMWYQGTAQANATQPFQSTIDYATSPDGVHWTKYAQNPVFYGFSLAGNTTSAWWPSVSKVNGTYVMAFSASVFDIGFAYSYDGIKWIFNNSTGVMLSLSGWHNGTIGNPSLLVDGNHLLLWFYGTAANTSVPHEEGVGFARCGTLITTPPTTSTLLLTSTTISTSISTSITTLPTTTTSFATTTQLVTDNPTLAGFQAAAAFSAGLIVALAIALALVWRKVRIQAPKAASAA